MGATYAKHLTSGGSISRGVEAAAAAADAKKEEAEVGDGGAASSTLASPTSAHYTTIHSMPSGVFKHQISTIHTEHSDQSSLQPTSFHPIPHIRIVRHALMA